MIKLQKMFFSFILIPLISFSDEDPTTMMVILPEEVINENKELTPIKFMPGLYVGELSNEQAEVLADQHPDIQIDTMPNSKEELSISIRSMLLETPEHVEFPINNWWVSGFTGKNTVVAVLDSGIPDNYVIDDQMFTRQSALNNRNLIVNRGPDSGFYKYINGVRTAHGTGVACIYTSIATGTQDILVTLAGDSEVDDTDWELTLYNLDWLLTTADQPKPHVINYSFGNGKLREDWSMIAQTVDYIVNHYQITWVKSAGNAGPLPNTLTIPADSYNAIVVANMNNTIEKTANTLIKTSDRSKHSIMPSSSRGPTLDGRRKPDLTAPGNDTRTCAPQTSVYAVPANPTFKQYTASSQYDPITETRLVGGTSMATPHVGAAAALIYDSGIKSPMAIKALLINSADTWTDVEGSEWSSTYGWGYINMDKAFHQRDNIIQGKILSKKSICFRGNTKANDKLTVVWEKRLEKLTSMKLFLYDQSGKVLLDRDDSKIDNVLQVSSYPHDANNILLKLTASVIEGIEAEPFVIVSGSKMERTECRGE